MKSNTEYRGLSLTFLISGCIIIGLSYMFVKWGLRYVNPYQLLSDRMLLVLVCIWVAKHLRIIKVTKINKRAHLRFIIISVIYPTMFFGFQVLGIALIPPSITSIIYSLLPVVTLLAAYFYLHERPTIGEILGAILSVAGVMYITLMTMQSGPINGWGYFFITISLLSFVVYLIILKQLSKHLDIISITYYILLYSAIIINLIYWIYAFVHQQENTTILFRHYQNIHYWLILGYLSILSTVLTSFCMNFSAKHLPATLVGIFCNLSPILGLFFAILIVGDQVYPYHIIGSITVFIGIILGSYKKTKQDNIPERFID